MPKYGAIMKILLALRSPAHSCIQGACRDAGILVVVSVVLKPIKAGTREALCAIISGLD